MVMSLFWYHAYGVDAIWTSITLIFLVPIARADHGCGGPDGNGDVVADHGCCAGGNVGSDHVAFDGNVCLG
ncbi:hypothetical protein Bca4012_064643 [Brassica carinata]|uniref:Uncharacterized protein n=1 Tax=Brassica carinata TaxID=52824 RepID=A0A8X8AVX9_BRACI|nr:hypothetical protein Bca52824_017142 [Brassica carinata]